MAAYSLSGKAVSDLDGIYEYTILNFGLEQTQGKRPANYPAVRLRPKATTHSIEYPLLERLARTRRRAPGAVVDAASVGVEG